LLTPRTLLPEDVPVESDPKLLLSLLAVRLLGGQSVPAADDALKALKKSVDKAVGAGLLRKGETRIATTTKAGKASSKKVAVIGLTPQGEEMLRQAAAPEAYAATQSGVLAALRQDLESDRGRLRDEVRAAVAATIGKRAEPAKVQKELDGLSKKVEQLTKQLEKLEAVVGPSDDGSALLAKIDQAFAGMQARLEGILRSLPTPRTELGPAHQPEPAPPSPGSLPEVLRKAYERLRLFVEFRDGLVEMPRLYHEARKAMPGLTVEEFHRELLALWDARTVELHVLNEADRAAEPDKGIEHHNKLYYYVLWKRP
jgi:hypothetical protein